MKLLKDLNIDDLEFKKMRETDTGSRIIDIDNIELYQTPWMKIIYEVEYNICVNAVKIQDILDKIDDKVVKYSSECLEFSQKEIENMYRPLLRQSGDLVYFSIPITTNTILFDKNRTFYDKSEIKNILKVNQYVRFIIRIQKTLF